MLLTRDYISVMTLTLCLQTYQMGREGAFLMRLIIQDKGKGLS